MERTDLSLASFFTFYFPLTHTRYLECMSLAERSAVSLEHTQGPVELRQVVEAEGRVHVMTPELEAVVEAVVEVGQEKRVLVEGEEAMHHHYHTAQPCQLHRSIFSLVIILCKNESYGINSQHALVGRRSGRSPHIHHLLCTSRISN